MFPDILTESQKALLPHLELFTSDYYLVGGTAIALHPGHRKSIDFDLFTRGKIKQLLINAWKDKLPFSPIQTLFESGDEIHFIISDVKVTFMQFPYRVGCIDSFYGVSMPSLLSLAGMKAFALNRRAKWKDYVDLYFMMKDHFALKEIIKEADDIFGSAFNSQLFRRQLSFFDDINYTEKVEYVGEPVEDEIIKAFLTEKSFSPF
ncbi:MAG: nucleotidyl transferase AbiEii/AbiGii toxin family protein [Candidatus Marinimicrobia bacterium]|nr:nucleotidyl transferase AbiEii/AbiGii toxin family protein [Candidatus Neomarinimicrobiota bacterium]